VFKLNIKLEINEYSKDNKEQILGLEIDIYHKSPELAKDLCKRLLDCVNTT
jgi:hypothetical protein